MSKHGYEYTYDYEYNEDYFKIRITRVGNGLFVKEAFVDQSVSDLVMKHGVRMRNGYLLLRKKGYHPVQHLILGHVSNREVVVDHINGDRLDNRRSNLRRLSQRDNANNRNFNSRSNTGVVGISERKNGNYRYYRAVVSDRKTLVLNSKAKSQTKRYSKQFNINKLGDSEAMRQAKRWLSLKKKEFSYV